MAAEPMYFQLVNYCILVISIQPKAQPSLTELRASRTVRNLANQPVANQPVANQPLFLYVDFTISAHNKIEDQAGKQINLKMPIG